MMKTRTGMSSGPSSDIQSRSSRKEFQSAALSERSTISNKLLPLDWLMHSSWTKTNQGMLTRQKRHCFLEDLILRAQPEIPHVHDDLWMDPTKSLYWNGINYSQEVLSNEKNNNLLSLESSKELHRPNWSSLATVLGAVGCSLRREHPFTNWALMVLILLILDNILPQGFERRYLTGGHFLKASDTYQYLMFNCSIYRVLHHMQFRD